MSVICPKCQKEFKNAQAYNMHNMRVHTGQIKTPGQLGMIKRKRVSQSNYDPENRWTQEQIDLLLVIEEQYKFGRNISWDKAFTEHPEWRADLGNRSLMALSGKLTYIKAHAKKRAQREAGQQPTQVIKTRPRGIQSVPQALPAQNGHVAFCPECGAHIKMWNHVAEVVRGLKQQQPQS